MDEDSRGLFQVPSTVHMEEAQVAETPRSSNRRKMLKKSIASAGAIVTGEVDAYENPTELFQWINYGNYQAAAVHALEHPNEVRTWIVSHKRGKKSGEDVKWRYLPLHLVCMKANPSEDLLRAVIYSYPAGASERDHDGNLPFHYLLSEGCANRDILHVLLKAYPESVDKRDKKGRSPLEIVSEGYRAGKLSKEVMVSMLAVLRQWAISEDRSQSGNDPQDHLGRSRGNAKHEMREAPPTESPVPAFTFDSSAIASKRSASRSRRSASRGRSVTRRTDTIDSEVLRIPPENGHKKQPRDGVEIRLETTLTERDILRKTNAKLKNETKSQEMALVALNKQVEVKANEQQRGREKLKKKKERIEDLEKQVKEYENRMGNHEQIFFDKEQKLAGQEKEIQLLNEQLQELQKEQDNLQENVQNHDEEAIRMSNLLDKTERENENLKQQMDELLQSRAQTENATDLKSTALQSRINELEETNKELRSQFRDVELVKSEAAATDSRLKGRIAALEREKLIENPQKGVQDKDGNYVHTPDLHVVVEERDALKEMNASLQEHVGALKERCRQLEENGTEKEELQKSIATLESDLIHARVKQTEYHEQFEHAKSECVIIESRLQTKLARLEKELLESRGKKDADVRIVSSTSDDDRSLEERRSLQMMNDSLQDHVAALKEKCNALETTLADAQHMNMVLSDDIRATQQSDIGNRQKELHSEFQHLYTMIQGMSSAGAGVATTRDAAKLKLENEVLRREGTHQKDRLSDLESQIARLHTELSNIRTAYGSMRATADGASDLQKERQRLQELDEKLRQDQSDHRLHAESVKDIEVRLQEMAHRADMYKSRLSDLKESFDKVKSNNSNLREIIAKNNETYLAKVGALNRELEDVRQVNKSLHSHVHDLSVDNERMRNGVSMLSTSNKGDELTQKLNELSERLNQVAGYLIAVSLMSREESSDPEGHTDGYGTEAENYFVGLNTDSARKELQAELSQRREDLLDTESRDDIIQNANAYGYEMMGGSKYVQQNLARQREELSSISATLNELS